LCHSDSGKEQPRAAWSSYSERRNHRRVGYRMKILIVDDHALVRRGMKEVVTDILSADHSPLSIQEADQAREALDFVRAQQWDLVLLDLSLPDRNGLEVLREIKSAQPILPVLALGLHAEDHFALRAFRAGASGFLSKDKGVTDMAVAVKKVLEGDRYISPELAQHLAVQGLQHEPSGRDHTGHTRRPLSDRELEILQWIARGQRLTQIAERLNLSVKTVSTYRSRILTKLGAHTTAELIRYAIDHHLT
jgi:DNA-binding NarL/FixJ family response regulator